MSFLFGSKPKVNPFSTQGLRLQLQKLAEESQSLKDQYDGQKQAAICTKTLLGIVAKLLLACLFFKQFLY